MMNTITWVKTSEKKPEAIKTVLVRVINKEKGTHFTTLAEYVPPKTLLAENYLNSETRECGDLMHYDEESDKYYCEEGWFETTYMGEDPTKYNVDKELYDVVSWAYLPVPQCIEE